MVTRSHRISPALPMIGRFEDCNTMSEIFFKVDTQSLLYHEGVNERKAYEPLNRRISQKFGG